MELIIQEIAMKVYNTFEKGLKSLLEEGKDISEFILATKKTLDETGVILVAEALETVNEAYRNSKERKRVWEVKERAAKKTLTTIFGEVRYERTYYRNKRTGKHCHLSDKAVGISAHDRLDASLKAKLIEQAIFMPYGESGKRATEAVDLTSQTVMNSIRDLGCVGNDAVSTGHDKRSLDILYIEADEDHVAIQQGGCAQPRLVYVHET